MAPPKRRNGEPDGEQDPALVEVMVGGRHVPVTLKSIALLLSVLITVGSCVAFLGSHVMWPWSKQDAAIVQLQAVVDTVQHEHKQTRNEIGRMADDISELKSDGRLTAQALCAMARKLAPENTPPGCAPIPRNNNGGPR